MLIRLSQTILTTAALVAANACAVPRPGAASSAALLDEHVHGFAMAYCLRKVADRGLPEAEAKVLREQGNRWGQVLVERSRGDYTLFFVIMPALDAALAETPMAMVKAGDTAGSETAPLFHCDQLLRQPAVMRAMARARASLAPAYAED
jgi:hypothetical protein